MKNDFFDTPIYGFLEEYEPDCGLLFTDQR